jgi:hypothetical protein
MPGELLLDTGAMLPEERDFNYHNPPDGGWRLQLLRSLLEPILEG